MSCPWSQFTPDPFPFCEEQICHIIGQPANTWSNIGYFIAAYFLWKHSDLGQRRYGFVVITFLLGMGSTIFHMSGTLWAKKLDVSAMILLSSFVLILGLQEKLKLSRKITALFYAALTLFSIPWIGYGRAGGNIFLVGLFVAVVLQIDLARGRALPKSLKSLLGRALLVFSIALVINMADQQGLLCWPNNHIFTGHGLWHLMTAYCIYLSARFFCQIPESRPRIE